MVIDRPGAQQSQIMGGYVGMPRDDPDYLAFEVLNSAFGGQFASRINLNLREDKGYTYGARSQLAGYRHGGLFVMSAPVQTNATAASITELLKEMSLIRGDKPLVGAELADSRNRLVQGFPQRFETFGGIARQLADLLLADLPLDDWQTYAGRVEALGEGDTGRRRRSGTWIPRAWSGSSWATGRSSPTACAAWTWARSRSWTRARS